MRTYKTLDGLFKAAGSHQVTAQEILNGRTRVHDEWQKIKVSEGLKDAVCIRLSEMFGGKAETKAKIYGRLRHGGVNHWGIQRVFLQKYSGKAFLSYCAGQDMPYEMRQIRKDLTV